MSHRRPSVFTCGQYRATFDFEAKSPGVLFGLATVAMVANVWRAVASLCKGFSWESLLMLVVCAFLLLGVTCDFAYWISVQLRMHKTKQDRFENYRELTSRFDSHGACGHRIRKGELIGWNRRHGAKCSSCWAAWKGTHAKKTTGGSLKLPPA